MNDTLPAFLPIPEVDAAIADWFGRQGWPVTFRHWDFDRDVFAWRHESLLVSRTLRMSRNTAEDWDTGLILTFLDEAKIAAQLSAHPDKYLLVHNTATGGITATLLDSAPPLKR